MRVVQGRPPNFEAIAEVFPAARKSGTIFTFGDTIYAPRAEVSEPLMAHEKIHSDRQGSDPEAWWAQYLKDAEFRFEEELLAHRAEFAWFRSCCRQERRFALSYISKRLASPLYGNIVTKEAAARLIKGGI